MKPLISPRTRTRSKAPSRVRFTATLISLFFNSMAGYAFAWLEFPGRDWAFIAVIGMLVSILLGVD